METHAGRIANEPRSSAKLKKVLFASSVAILPFAVGAAINLLTRSRRNGLVAGGITAAALGIARWQLERTFNDEPDYTVEERVGDLEIRRYDARVEAETTIEEADFANAIEHGFRRLADYIFGANDRKEELGMTTPVTSKLVDGDSRIAFMMPMTRTASSLPAPTDGRIEITEVPARRVAVLAFRGKGRAKLVENKASELRRLVADAGLAAKGEPIYAAFDPPWTLPFMRRNELWIELV